MTEKVFCYMKEHQMIAENDYVVAGVSGGADSVCLLYMLLELRKRLQFTIHVVHINHMMREEAKKDAAYVETLCKKHELPFTLVCRDVEKEAGEQRLSTEEAGRRIRYETFSQVLAEYAGGRRGRIAVAHNKNDCGETFLFHLFRGSGLQGLSGIRPVRDNIIRPLLCLERTEIEGFLQEKQIFFCIDKTNLEDNYTRNRIRHHILPTAEAQISRQSLEHISEACERISEAYDLIEDLTTEAYKECVRTDEKGIHIMEEPFQRLHRTLQGYCLREALAEAAGSRRDIEKVHIQQLFALWDRQCGKRCDLPYGIAAWREYGGIRLAGRQEKAQAKEPESRLTADMQARLEAGERVVLALSEQEELEISLKKVFDRKNIPQKTYTKWFDYDKIKNSIVIRRRKQGDFLTINSSYQRKSLKSYFIDEKIPREDRDRIRLIAEESHVIWILGGRVSSFYKVSDTTEKIMEIKYIRRS